MKVEIIYLKKADKFFNKNKNFKKDEITALVLKALKKIILNEDVNIDIMGTSKNTPKTHLNKKIDTFQ